MSEVALTLKQIVSYTNDLQQDGIRRALILYEEGIHYIGDACVRFDKIRYFKSFLNNADITINFNRKHSDKIYDALLINNPHVYEFFSKDRNAIDLQAFDIIFCIAYDEECILQFIHDKYGAAIVTGHFRPVVYSLSDFMLEPEPHSKFVFPVHAALVDYCRDGRRGELYITQQERVNAEQWLQSRGMKDSEYLFVILDSTSDRTKLIKITVYFEFLLALLAMEDVKVLIFDENNIGKEEFYREWLGSRQMEKIIVSKALSLRDNICLATSRYTKLIFGPCTGLLHCASSVYNHYLNNGMSRKHVPVMITYTGRYVNNTNAGFWWADAPLVYCIMLKELNNQKELVRLNDLSEEEQQKNDSLPCSEYTARLLLDFVHQQIRLQSLQLAVG